MRYPSIRMSMYVYFLHHPVVRGFSFCYCVCFVGLCFVVGCRGVALICVAVCRVINIHVVYYIELYYIDCFMLRGIASYRMASSYHIISYIISYRIGSYHIIYSIIYHIIYHISYRTIYRIKTYHISYRIVSYHIKVPVTVFILHFALGANIVCFSRTGNDGSDLSTLTLFDIIWLGKLSMYICHWETLQIMISSASKHYYFVDYISMFYVMMPKYHFLNFSQWQTLVHLRFPATALSTQVKWLVLHANSPMWTFLKAAVITLFGFHHRQHEIGSTTLAWNQYWHSRISIY